MPLTSSARRARPTETCPLWCAAGRQCHKKCACRKAGTRVPRAPPLTLTGMRLLSKGSVCLAHRLGRLGASPAQASSPGHVRTVWICMPLLIVTGVGLVRGRRFRGRLPTLSSTEVAFGWHLYPRDESLGPPSHHGLGTTRTKELSDPAQAPSVHLLAAGEWQPGPRSLPRLHSGRIQSGPECCDTESAVCTSFAPDPVSPLMLPIQAATRGQLGLEGAYLPARPAQALYNNRETEPPGSRELTCPRGSGCCTPDRQARRQHSR